MEQVTVRELKNGIRLVHYRQEAPVSYCGMLINTGSRDEDGHPQGVAHFMEHMLFKGTEKRKTFHILSRIDEVGGELNAYTSKENTFIYASFLHTYLARAVDIIADITFHSTFPEKEIRKERTVILDEIMSYRDDPSEEIGDQFDENMFRHHALGKNILGTETTVSAMSRADILRFREQTYHTDQMVFCCISKGNGNDFFREAEKVLEGIRARTRKHPRRKFRTYKPFTLSESRSINTSHCMLGNTSYGIKHPGRLAFFMLNNILGGPGLNSRLNIGIRERYGYTYFLDSSYTAFEETGQWMIYLATDEKKLEKTIDLVHRELRLLREKPLSTLQLHKAKQQLKGQLALSNENMSGLLHVIARSHLVFNRLDSLEKLYKQIDALSAAKLQDVARDVFDRNSLSQLVYRNA